MYPFNRNIITIFIFEKNRKKPGKRITISPGDWKYISKMIAIEFNLSLHLYIQLYSCDNGNLIKCYQDLINKGCYTFKSFNLNRNLRVNNYPVIKHIEQNPTVEIVNCKKKPSKIFKKAITKTHEGILETRLTSSQVSEQKIYEDINNEKSPIHTKGNRALPILLFNKITHSKIFDINFNKIISKSNIIWNNQSRQCLMGFYDTNYNQFLVSNDMNNVLSFDFINLYQTQTAAMLLNETSQQVKDRNVKDISCKSCNCTLVHDLTETEFENECLCDCHCFGPDQYDTIEDYNQNKMKIEDKSSADKIFDLITETIEMLNTMKKLQSEILKAGSLKEKPQVSNKSITTKDICSTKSESIQASLHSSYKSFESFKYIATENTASSLNISEILNKNDSSLNPCSNLENNDNMVSNEEITQLSAINSNPESTHNHSIATIKHMYEFLLPVEENICKYLNRIEDILAKEDEKLFAEKALSSQTILKMMEDKEVNTVDTNGTAFQPFWNGLQSKCDVAVETSDIDEGNTRKKQKNNLFTSCFRFCK